MLRGRLPEPNVPKADLCAIKAPQLSPDSQLAIAEDNRGNVRAIATDTGTASWEASLPSYSTALQLSPDGQLAIGGDAGGNVGAIGTDSLGPMDFTETFCNAVHLHESNLTSLRRDFHVNLFPSLLFARAGMTSEDAGAS